MALLRTLRLATLALLSTPGLAPVAMARDAAPDAVFYHVFVRSFRDGDGDRIGDLRGLEQGLGYLQRLGVTTILLTPVQPSPFYHNYFATDFTGVARDYGGRAAWRHLLRAAHARHLRVYMDLEFQYVADHHPWLAQTWHHPQAPGRSRLIWDAAQGGSEPLVTPFGREVMAADGTRHTIAFVNLTDPALRGYFRRYLLRWADPHGDGSGRDGVDGFRIDHMMDDLDNRHVATDLFDRLWRPLIAAVKARRPGVRFVGEQWDWGDGHDFLTRGHADMVFAFPLQQALARLDKTAIISAARATAAATPPGKSQVVFLENHDTDRFMSVIGDDPPKARAGAALLLALRGEPSIYYGQELGMRGRRGPAEPTDAPDIPRREAFRWRADLEAAGSAIWYRALDRVWTRRANRAFDGVSVEEQDQAAGSLLNWYRELIALRRTRPELATGDQTFPCADASPVLCVLRRLGTRRTLVMVNLSNAPAPPALDATVPHGGWRLLAGEGTRDAPLAPYATRMLGTR